MLLSLALLLTPLVASAAAATPSSDAATSASSLATPLHGSDDNDNDVDAGQVLVTDTNQFHLFGNAYKNGSDIPKKKHKHARPTSDGEECEPRKVKPKKRCAYVRALPSCKKEDNLLHYLEIHYCTLGREDAWQFVKTLW